MHQTNPNSRLEAFCDGVFAIALTLLIIDIAIPSGTVINSSTDLWRAILRIAPSIFAFLLSFSVIFITWVNHHASLRLVNRSSVSFIYANGFLLLTIVFIPFPTALLGEYILTDDSAPAVVIYNSVTALQAVAWIWLCRAAIKDNLTKDDKSKLAIQTNLRNGYFALVVYTICAIVAFWFPRTIAGITTLLWIFWLIHGISITQEER